MAGSEDIQNGNDEIGSQSDPSLGPVWLSPIVRRWSIILVCVLAAARQTHAASEIMEKASARFSIFLIAQELRAHFDSTGSFPATLEELDLDEEGIEYLTNGTTFRLVVVEGSNSIVYAEGEDSEIFRSSFKVLEEGAVQ